MIYLDTSVALAHLLAEDRRPDESLWRQTLISSRLLEYELWTRVHARDLGESHGAVARELLERIGFLELRHEVLARASESFPVAVRTLDALHLASIRFLVGMGFSVELATYDARLAKAARKLGVPVLAP